MAKGLQSLPTSVLDDRHATNRYEQSFREARDRVRQLDAESKGCRSSVPKPHLWKREVSVSRSTLYQLSRKSKTPVVSQYSHIADIRFLVLSTIFEQLKLPNCHIPDFQKLVEKHLIAPRFPWTGIFPACYKQLQ
jgi:hypothetical protein